ncbi:MAG: molybdate ABC transporter substrate-binding protein [Steroidobacteraceae bacterium]|nr:molybdate ABC transporter substrate-binding protein [Steroidobacteraceae bacterium]
MTRVLRNLLLAVLLAVSVVALPSHGGEVRVAAAADLKYAFDEIMLAFRAERPDVAVRVTYGSSGNFYAQLRSRAPFDVFLSADLLYPRRLADDGLALGSEVFAYAVGRIVLWVPGSSPLEVDRLGIRALLDPSVRRIAIANPRHAPYGVAAEAALRSLGVYDAVAGRLVLGENVAQTAQFVQSRAADAGIIALSLVVAPPMRGQGRYWEIPLEAYPTMEQGGMITPWARDAAAARALRDYMLGPAGRAILERYGFVLPWTGKPSG